MVRRCCKNGCRNAGGHPNPTASFHTFPHDELVVQKIWCDFAKRSSKPEVKKNFFWVLYSDHFAEEDFNCAPSSRMPCLHSHATPRFQNESEKTVHTPMLDISSRKNFKTRLQWMEIRC